MEEEKKQLNIIKKVKKKNGKVENYSIAANYEKMGDYENAAKYYFKVITEENRRDTWIYKKAGAVFKKIGKYVEALDCYKKAKEFNGKNSSKEIDAEIAWLERKMK